MVEISIPDEAPDLTGIEMLPPSPRGQSSERGNLVKSWVLWWVCQSDAPTQKAARKALVAAAGVRVSKEQRARWVRWAFRYLSDTPSSLRDHDAIRTFIADKTLVLASKASRAAVALIPDAFDRTRLEGPDLQKQTKSASELGTMAIRGFDSAVKLMHLDRRPPDRELDERDVPELILRLPGLFAICSAEQLTAIEAMIAVERRADDAGQDIVGAIGL